MSCLYSECRHHFKVALRLIEEHDWTCIVFIVHWKIHRLLYSNNELTCSVSAHGGHAGCTCPSVLLVWQPGIMNIILGCRAITDKRHKPNLNNYLRMNVCAL